MKTNNVNKLQRKTQTESDRADLGVADCGPANGPMTRGPRQNLFVMLHEWKSPCKFHFSWHHYHVAVMG